ncbi:hypothetical protein Mesil_3658 (plasmid) [Allomeiothermus silvanus DSM 9946]|uniref:Uncharacterized protein n=1 Tax=Allomeiothermus silvanus (strain ATCC 700542 / DSM 9946 / NBRC 106475 / NCIMB 13440 / VI-R2) TaxID=526227 RepID=D7BJT8_ALLS1|nr:hypothetical protein [Allomeiothermus silvanus]ADH65444.1 hypothetical protein Mesil_3658 [Allomeiothermus silvanus DSM 9946]
MNEEKAREMARSIIAEVKEEIARLTARVRTGVVPDLERLTQALQTYRAGRYVTHPAVWPKGKYSYDYTLVEVAWQDEEWTVAVSRSSTVIPLSRTEGVFPPPTADYLVRRDGNLVMKDKLLRKDPESGVYLCGDYHPPQEILQVAAAGPYRVEVYRTVVNVRPDTHPLVLCHNEPDRRVKLRHGRQEARVSLEGGQLLSQFVLWRMLE